MTINTNNDVFPEQSADDRKALLQAQALQPSEMTDSEKLTEILVINREIQSLVSNFFDDMMSGKMNVPGPLGMFFKMMGPSK